MSDASTVPAALRSLLAHLVDYAGLFPPARRSMADAVREYAGHLASDARWMLGRFVVPASRLEELARELLRVPVAERGARWSVSALALPPDVPGDVWRIKTFNAQIGALAIVDAVETKAFTPAEVDAAANDVQPVGASEVYVELPHAVDAGARQALFARVRAAGVRAKIRTGGVTPDAFPTPPQVAAFIASCASAEVAFKATAGLHHPLCADYRLTYEPGAPLGRMFGFLNVFVAAAAARDGSPEPELVAILTECDAAAFSFDAAGISWRDHRIDAATVEASRREFAIAFGSCSFGEPVEDLKALRLLG